MEVGSAAFDLDGRRDVFARVSDFAYLPAGAEAVVTSEHGGAFALPNAPAVGRRDPAYVPALAVPIEVRGGGVATRQVNNFCSADAFDAERLIAVEVLTPDGNWSSFPPHKHDELTDREVPLEEIYYFRIGGGDHGFGLHRTYTIDREIDQTVTVRDGDVFSDPAGLPWSLRGRAGPPDVLLERDGRTSRARVADVLRPRARVVRGGDGGPRTRPPLSDDDDRRTPRRGREELTEMERISHWIGGKIVVGESGRSGPVFDPAKGVQTHEVDFATPDEVDLAVQAAAEAFPAWRATSLSKRAEIMFRIHDLVEEHRIELARILTAQHGKVISDAAGEVQRGIENLEFATAIPTLLKGGFSEQVSTGVDVYSIRQPLGVVAGITPFNFPAMVPMWMFANALACGNTFVLKPSEKDPGASMFIAELLKEAGIPDGAFNVIHGDKVAVDTILEHPVIQAVSFVGSTPIARYIYENGTKRGKRVQALGGAKNHMIVLPDADLDMAADAAVSAGYGSAGERCMAVSAVVAVGGVGDELVKRIADRLPKVKVGAGTEPDVEMGPLVTREHRDKVASYLESGAEQGATVVRDGRDDPVTQRDGFFLGVSLLDHVTPDMDAYKDEIFGPVLGVLRVDTYDEAVRLVNENPYGNGVAIFTRDGGAARQFQFEIQAGMVGVNVPIPVPVAYYSFGGWKSSLFGDNHMYGPEGVQFYTRAKVVTSRWPDPSTSSVDLGFPRTR